MNFNSNFFETYVSRAPLALAIERNYECEILSQQKFERPVLDLGCGDGIFSSILFKEKIDLGIDPDQTELARAEKLDAYKELISCYGDRVPRPSGYFKSIFSNSVMEHIPEIGAVLKECHRLLADDGRLYLTLPNERFERYSLICVTLEKLGLVEWSIKFRSFFNKFWAHYHAYSVQEWTELFENAGFEVESVREYNSKRSCVTNDILAYFALSSFLSRKFLKRWFVVPRLRAAISPMLSAIWKGQLDAPDRTGPSGLVFFALRKTRAV